MNGREHAGMAEDLLAQVAGHLGQDQVIAAAQVHATLAVFRALDADRVTHHDRDGCERTFVDN